VSECAQLKVRVIPRAKRTAFAGWRGDRLVIRLQAPPVEGAANEALRKFLAKALGIRKSDIEIVTGERSREKTLRIYGLTQEQLRQRLADAGAEL